MPIDIIYSRVSKKDETVQDIITHESQVKKKFNLKNPILLKDNEDIRSKLPLNRPIILRERGTAYNMDKFKDRKNFIKLIDFAFDSEKTTIKNLYMQNFTKKNIRLFLWDSHRLMRNFEYSLESLLLSDFFGVDIYTYKDGKLKPDEEETPIKKFARYILFSVHAFSGAEYSYTTSENIKKSVKSSHGITIGTHKDSAGRKWGRPFVNAQANKVFLKPLDIKKLNERILYLDKYYRKRNDGFYYNRLILKILKEFDIKISKSYITSLKK